MIDASKFGLTSWKVYIQLNTMEKHVNASIIDYLNKLNNVWWIIKCEGNFDLMFSALTKTVHELYRILHDFQTKFSRYESRIEITTHINTDFTTRGYLLNQDSKKIATVLEEPVIVKLDNIDVKILKILAKDSRIPSTQIAQKLNISLRIVIYRIKELLRKKVISHFRLIPNVNIIGMDYYKVMIQIKDLTQPQENSLINFLEYHPNIINNSSSWGPWEIEFETEIEDYKALTKLINELRDKFSNVIKKIEFILIKEEIKATNDFLDYMHY